MGVKTVKSGGRGKPKATPKKAPPKRKSAPPKKEATPKVKPETKANNVATPKPKPVKSKPAPKKKPSKKKSVSNNTPVKKEVDNAVPVNDVPVEKKERKRGAAKIENEIPSKRVAKEKPVVETPAKKKPGRGRPALKANNVVASAKKKTVDKKTPVKAVESTPAKATNNVDKKQSKPKQVKKSPGRAKKTAAPKTPNKSIANEGKPVNSPKATKAKASGGKRGRKATAAKTKSVLMNPVVELEPLEHYTDFKQTKTNPTVVLPRIRISSKVKTEPVVLLRRVNLDVLQKVEKTCTVLIPRLRNISTKQDKTENESLQNTTKELSIRLPEIDAHAFENCSQSNDETTVPYENGWLNKKYKPYMEKIQELTHEEISIFIKNNREHYERIRDTKKQNNCNKGNSSNADTKDLFKCNPFNSSQQLAMYLTLREIFNVPEQHLKECKFFFTVIMPEISCQLFAEIFHIKVNSAPRMIKKLYPVPISPF